MKHNHKSVLLSSTAEIKLLKLYCIDDMLILLQNYITYNFDRQP